MDKVYDVLIVGAGHGGSHAASMLRQLGYRGTIGIVSDEPCLPYERPPLSKDYLSGTKPFERLVFRSAGAWAEKGIDVLLGQRVTGVDPRSRCVATANSGELRYGTLVWAAGGEARALGCPGAELAGVHTLRKLADADRLIAELPATLDVAVIGGGYIGLEVAAVLRKADKRVTLLEALDRVLARVAGEPLSRFYEAEHRAHGVDVRLSAKVECILSEGGRAAGVRLSGGELIPAQMVIVGIGIAPSVAPLVAAGAAAGDGIRVDGFCRTSLADVYAIGDCAEHRSGFAQGEWVRIESVQNAHDQATTVARAICGIPEPYDALPWFWSNQYDLKLQTVGLSREADEVVIRGAVGSRAFSLVYLRGGRVIALDCVNAARDYAHGRSLVVAAAAPDRGLLSDPDVPLKSLCPSGRCAIRLAQGPEQ